MQINTGAPTGPPGGLCMSSSPLGSETTYSKAIGFSLATMISYPEPPRDPRLPSADAKLLYSHSPDTFQHTFCTDLRAEVCMRCATGIKNLLTR